MQDYLCECAAWGLLQPQDLKRLAQEGKVDQEVAHIVSEAVQAIGSAGAKKEVKAALPSSSQYLQIKVCPWGLIDCHQRLLCI